MTGTEQNNLAGFTTLDRVFSWGLFLFWLAFWACLYLLVKG